MHKRLVTCEINGKLSITEPSRRFVFNEVSSIRREIGFNDGFEIVIVSRIGNGIAEQEQCWNQRLCVDNHHSIITEEKEEEKYNNEI